METGNWKLETGNWKLETGNRKPETGNRKPETGNWKIHYFKEINSTMDMAREMAKKGCPEFTVVVAGQQNAGRGRLKRVWISSQGGLWFTIVLRPRIVPGLGFRINFCASLTLVRTLRRMFGVNAMVKWPNDILADEKKIVGILSEMETEGDEISFINIGIGINVNNDPTSEEPNASSLKNILNREISREELLLEFLNEFEHQMNHGDFDNLISEWKKYAITLNRHVKVVTTHDVSEGLATDVDEEGALILRLEDGSIKRVIYGDCFHQHHSVLK
ncbi:Biotin--acetyl-CoA-carboxylase ligase [Desulfonema magnum]|uniref:biotin--[biotin carboxyl-carrier protein] ligase n=1 Tax=Desulfonema magnum TaxID=45655 RepID=A0A975BQW8_9BACT|nr:Biotin--acetyl-CoA-carboxylase ligase [Desulfonema magnum]